LKPSWPIVFPTVPRSEGSGKVIALGAVSSGKQITTQTGPGLKEFSGVVPDVPMEKEALELEPEDRERLFPPQEGGTLPVASSEKEASLARPPKEPEDS